MNVDLADGTNGFVADVIPSKLSSTGHTMKGSAYSVQVFRVLLQASQTIRSKSVVSSALW